MIQLTRLRIGRDEIAFAGIPSLSRSCFFIAFGLRFRIQSRPTFEPRALSRSATSHASIFAHSYLRNRLRLGRCH